MILEEIDSLFDGAIGFLVEDDISSFFRSEKQYRIGKANFSRAEETPIQEDQQQKDNHWTLKKRTRIQ